MPSLLGTQLALDKCPHCRVNFPNLTWISESSIQNYLGFRSIWFVYRCNRCASLVTANADGENYEILGYYPSSGDPLSEDIPSRVREFLRQGLASSESPVGAVMLAASAVDAMLKEKGLTNGDLYPRINEAASTHLITEDMSKWAHNVRLDANDQRHADVEAELPNSSDAKLALDFALALAEILFVLPARVTRGITPEASTP